MKKKRGADDSDEDVEEVVEKVVADDGDTSTDVSDAPELKQDDEDDDTDSTSVGSQSVLYKLKEKLTGKKSSKEDDGTVVGGNKPADKKKQIIRYVIIGAVVILIASEFFPSDEEAPAEGTATTETPGFKKPIRKKVVKEPEPEAPVVAEEPTPVAEEPVTTPTEPAVTTETPTATEEPVVTAPAEETPVETTPPVVDEEPVIATPSGSEDSIDGENKSPVVDENLTDKILEDLEKQAKTSQVKNKKPEYVSPPDYEYRGRGLVYNCVGKHWACVDGPGYKTCEDNSAGNKFLKKKAECYPFNVYDSQKGCENMQNRVVSSSAKTDFCKE